MGRELQIQQPFSLPPPPLPPLPPTSSARDDPHHPPSSSPDVASSQPTSHFDASRMIGIIRRKALIKDLAALYHSECLTYCQELLELQKKLDETRWAERKYTRPHFCKANPKYLFPTDKPEQRPLLMQIIDLVFSLADLKAPENSRKDVSRPTKRLKKTR